MLGGDRVVRAVLFDLDGTLTDPKEGITRCMQYALGKLERPTPTADALVAYIGPPLQHTFAQLLATDDNVLVDQAVAYYRERFASEGMYENAVYPGVAAMLAELKRAGLRLFLATSKPHVFAEQIVAHFGLACYFDGVYGAELDGRLSDKAELIAEILRAEQLDAATTLMVGDRLHDIVGGKHNGVSTAAVTFGYGSRAELEAHQPDLLIDSPAALVQRIVA
ncbi:MAG: HAD hydrolase-like protein [Anaerolineales bacterium]|nr:HAD hydrolase-like protein [Anaerolineales bacterium]